MSDKTKRARYQRLLAENMALSEKLVNRCLDCDKIDAAAVEVENAELKRQVEELTKENTGLLANYYERDREVTKWLNKAVEFQEQLTAREAELAVKDVSLKDALEIIQNAHAIDSAECAAMNTMQVRLKQALSGKDMSRHRQQVRR